MSSNSVHDADTTDNVNVVMSQSTDDTAFSDAQYQQLKQDDSGVYETQQRLEFSFYFSYVW